MIVLDTNILINFFHIDRADIFEKFSSHAFVITEHVFEEITQPAQQKWLDKLLHKESLSIVKIIEMETLTLFGHLTNMMGHGEASSLAYASNKQCVVASDEKRAFLTEAKKRLGDRKIVTTLGLLVLAIRSNQITIAEADNAKLKLESHRFKIPIRSFTEVV